MFDCEMRSPNISVVVYQAGIIRDLAIRYCQVAALELYAARSRSRGTGALITGYFAIAQCNVGVVGVKRRTAVVPHPGKSHVAQELTIEKRAFTV